MHLTHLTPSIVVRQRPRWLKFLIVLAAVASAVLVLRIGVDVLAAEAY